MTLERPHFLLIGAMKCATSTLHVQLAAQPGIWMSEPKEPNFFSDPDVWARGLEWYAGLFRGAAPGDLCGESSTHYTKLPTHPGVVARIREHLGPDVRFIYLMRDPVERLLAHYVHDWTERIIREAPDAAIDAHPALVDYGCYARQLEPYLDAFGSERVLPVFVERLRAEPEAVLRRVCAFIGYPGAPVWHAEIGARNVSAERLRRSALRDALVEAPGLRALRRRFVPPRLRERIKSFWRLSERPTLGPAARARVEEIFDRDLAKLGDWLGLPLRCAGFAESVSQRDLDWTGRHA